MHTSAVWSELTPLGSASLSWTKGKNVNRFYSDMWSLTQKLSCLKLRITTLVLSNLFIISIPVIRKKKSSQVWKGKNVSGPGELSEAAESNFGPFQPAVPNYQPPKWRVSDDKSNSAVDQFAVYCIRLVQYHIASSLTYGPTPRDSNSDVPKRHSNQENIVQLNENMDLAHVNERSYFCTSFQIG